MSATAKTAHPTETVRHLRYDPVALAESLASAAEKSAKLIGDFAARQAEGRQVAASPTSSASARRSWSSPRRCSRIPYRLAESQMNLWWDYMNLWQALDAEACWAAPPSRSPRPRKGDKRFKHEDWEEHFLFDYIKQSYLITARWLHDAVAQRRRPRRAHEEEGRLLHAPVHRRAGAVELRADQSGGVPRDDRDRRPEPRQGPAQPARRHRARQRPAQDLDDRHQGLRARRQHRDHAGQGRLPERADAADPVRADDGEGRASGRC